MLYDDQALSFDDRAGLPAEACMAVADALADLVGLTEDSTLVEIGAGTGLLSIPLLLRGIRYIGFDRSPLMLDVFRQKLAVSSADGGPDMQDRAELVVADANERWPAPDGVANVVFSARALHHVVAEHAATETLRVLAPTGGWLVVGRVRRQHDSVKNVLRRQMRQLLRDAGYQGRSNEAQAGAVFAELEQAVPGRAERRDPIVAARWSAPHRPADSLAAWEGKQGLAGVELPADAKAEILGQLRAFAVRQYGDLDVQLESEECFELLAMHI